MLHRGGAEAPGVPAPHTHSQTTAFSHHRVLHRGSGTTGPCFTHSQKPQPSVTNNLGASERRGSGTRGPCTTHTHKPQPSVTTGCFTDVGLKHHGFPAPHTHINKPQPPVTTGCFTESRLRPHGSLHQAQTLTNHSSSLQQQLYSSIAPEHP